MRKMDNPVAINIKSEWVETAQNFAAEQDQANRQKQIFLQTLAIYGLHEYLTWGEIKGSLAGSYSWHPQTRVLTAWADLYLPNYGRILCVPNQNQSLIQLPKILPLNCIGCVVVGIADNLQKLELQGFISARSFDLEKKQFCREDITAIASLFDELYLLTEERLLVEQEILRLSAMDDDLENYFSPLLDSENIIDIVGRLNRLYYEPKSHPENVFIVKKVDMGTTTNASLLTNVAENSEAYSTDTPPQKIAEATQALTENLLVKLQQLRDELT